VATIRFSQIILNASIACQYQTQRHLTGQANPLFAKKIPIYRNWFAIFTSIITTPAQDALIWKLDALDALPFEHVRTLAYIDASKGPDLLSDFQEEKGSEPQLATVIEIENNFYNYKS